MVTSRAPPPSPRAGAVNEVAIEKKITVPPWAVASTAPPSQPGTSTQTTVTSAGPPALRTGPDSAMGARASAISTWSASPLLLAGVGVVRRLYLKPPVRVQIPMERVTLLGV